MCGASCIVARTLLLALALSAPELVPSQEGFTKLDATDDHTALCSLS